MTGPAYRRENTGWVASPQGLDLRLDVVDIRGLSLFRLGTLGTFVRELSGRKDDMEGGHEDQSPNVG